MDYKMRINSTEISVWKV